MVAWYKFVNRKRIMGIRAIILRGFVTTIDPFHIRHCNIKTTIIAILRGNISNKIVQLVKENKYPS